MKNFVRKIYWLLSVQFGFDPRRMIRSFSGLFRYIRDWFHFHKNYQGQLEWLPCLHDWYEEGGSTKDEYFLQDLYVARKVYLANPVKHIDIGSRIDGFVAHVASFREIEVFDIRPVSASISGILFKQADLMNPCESLDEYSDSLSCLHALEHFGLGRYGDPIDVYGYRLGLANMIKMLRSNGLFYLSVPIGIARVEFNAHRVFDPREIVQLAEQHHLILERFAWVQLGLLTESINPEKDFDALACSRYALGIFIFRKQTK